MGSNPTPGTWPAALILCAASIAALACAPAAGAATAGPPGEAFYTPPSPLPGGDHGSVIWSRPLTGSARLPSAARNLLVLYRSAALDGRAIAVSGTVAVPRGRAPRGGWPVVSWAHGTTGIADLCAPSRDAPEHPSHAYLARATRLLDRYVRRGYAVVQTDYEGLGTPGEHPYLIGVSQARGVADIVRAARRLDPAIGRRWLVMGHSQGGHATLFTAGIAARWTPDLRLAGAAALAPASQLSTLPRVLPTLTSANAAVHFFPFVLRGAMAASASVRPELLLTPGALAKLALADTGCAAQLRAPEGWGSLLGSEVLRADADPGPLVDVLKASEPGRQRLGVPVLIAQGEADTVVLRVLTDGLSAALGTRGARVSYSTFRGADHVGVLEASYRTVSKWVRSRLAPPAR